MAFKSFIIVLGALIVSNCFSQSSPQPARPGIVDVSNVDFTDTRLNLNLSWIWYDNKLLLPSELDNHEGVPVEFPGIWNERRTSESGQGYATYALSIVLPSSASRLALDMPDLYSSYILFINDKEVARNGTPGKSAQTTIPQWRTQVVPIRATTDTIKLTLQVANFNHYKGGVRESILLGSEDAFSQKELVTLVAKTTAVGLLFILAIVFFVIYFRSGRKIVVIYFSLLCITWAVRALFSNDYLITRFYPDFDWTLMIRIEYITLYLTMIWAILFLCGLFVNEGNQVMKYILVAFNCSFAIYTMITLPIEFTRLLSLYLITAGVLLIYGAGVVLVALINERKGAVYLTISILLGLMIFTYDIFTYEGWFSYNTILFSAGYFVMFLLTGGALLLHLNILKGTRTATTMLTYEDLYGKGEQ